MNCLVLQYPIAHLDNEEEEHCEWRQWPPGGSKDGPRVEESTTRSWLYVFKIVNLWLKDVCANNTAKGLKPICYVISQGK